MTFVKVDTEAEQQLDARSGIMSIPTLMVRREEVPEHAPPGALPAAALAKLIEAVQALDMEEVHRTLAAQSSDTEAAPDDGSERETTNTAADVNHEHVEVDVVQENGAAEKMEETRTVLAV